VANPSEYRSLTSALQYLTLTRPDLGYSVQQVCLFMHDPHEPHLALIKCILRYVKGTLSSGLHIGIGAVQPLSAYSNAYWASCPDSRRYTSGFYIFLGDNLVSWSLKRQTTVSRSSAEAEYRAGGSGTRGRRVPLASPEAPHLASFCDGRLVQQR